MVYPDKLSAYYLELAQSPISAGGFAGEDIRFSAGYEALENELDKARSIHGNSQPDWQGVRDKSEALLRHESKDLRVVAWLTWALYQRESFPGLLAGLGMLRELCEHHWATVHPIKLRTRIAAFAWLVQRIEPVLAQSFALKDQRSLFQGMAGHLARLDELWVGHLGDDAPLLLAVRRQLGDKLQQALESDPPPSGVSGVVAQVKQAAAQLLAPEPVVNNEKDVHKLLRTLQDNARPLCTWWLRQNATDLRALRLNRTLTWLGITALPDSNSEQITPLRGLAPDKLKRYQERLAQGHCADLLLELEASLAGAPFWFDGVRMVWECLQALQAELAMVEVEIQFALLLQRLPGVAQLRFHDGAPFADAATRGWIDTQVSHHLQIRVPVSTRASAGPAPWEEALQAIAPLLRKEGLKAAVQAYKNAMQAARGERARFYWRLGLARLCVQGAKHDLARVQLEQLEQELQHCGLYRWEPDLTLEVLQLLYACYDVLPQGHGLRERKDEIHRKLCQVDLEAVLE
ncbi:type VI secretion system protein TssA [Pseudomonas gessardii]|uniref:Type VI secretion system protein TssA n=1 Tax=Pseudomonas gessardii TaxID=78544 RepID=A0ABS9F1N4_9PSED|nr:type VI secretion system protein TssA [Pseudomonas gessardii]MCF4980481.1 type VI secretion system protein TssA [Pseudomonas gessardii]MCF4991476.1 type VI secretion system protein TssA [Pseudomonas gessardii]MCF5085714.1 type VI secretion system protein TssA [Pseudomonas gessardii]MCF5095996.1 type VI secretion system protein TssA [Pseudomonas gessardii]MCF5106283.1 type VI secretion system protein TssA [Pseudomonas gessardii]